MNGLTIVQPSSPLLSVAGAEPGMIYDGYNFHDGPQGVLLVLVTFRHTYIQVWPPQYNKGNGIIKDWGSDRGILKHSIYHAGRDLMRDGSEILQVAEYNALLVDSHTGKYDRVVIRLQGDEYSKARALNTVISRLWVEHPTIPDKTYNPAMFYRAYRFQSLPEYYRFGWCITAGPDVIYDLRNGENIYLAARALRGELEAAL